MKTLWNNHISLFGYGAGAVSQGTQYIEQQKIIFISKEMGETGIRNLLLEFGIIGLVVFYSMWGSILYFMQKTIKMIRDPVLKRLNLAIFLFVIAALLRFTFMHFQVLNDYAVLIPLWFFIGVFFRLKQYEGVTHYSDLSSGIQPRGADLERARDE